MTAPEARPTTYWKGNKVEYTGKAEESDVGTTFYQVRVLEGHEKGKLKDIVKPPLKAMTPTVYHVLELDARGRLNRIRGMFVAVKDNPPVVIPRANIAIEEIYQDDVALWLEIAAVPH